MDNKSRSMAIREALAELYVIRAQNCAIKTASQARWLGVDIRKEIIRLQKVLIDVEFEEEVLSPNSEPKST